MIWTGPRRSTRTITDPYAHYHARALAGVAAAAVQAGALDRARPLVADAEALARSLTDPGIQAWVLTGVATAAAQAGDLDRAEALARIPAGPGYPGPAARRSGDRGRPGR